MRARTRGDQSCFPPPPCVSVIELDKFGLIVCSDRGAYFVYSFEKLDITRPVPSGVVVGRTFVVWVAKVISHDGVLVFACRLFFPM